MLKDKFGRVHDYLRISITDKCNFRCYYCLPGNNGGVSDKSCQLPSIRQMSADEIVDIAKIFVNDYGVNKIRLTGGEPLIRKDAHAIIKRLGDLSVELAITTNAVFLDKFLPLFKEVGLNSINISLDTLVKSKFNRITKRSAFNTVSSNIHKALSQGFYVKINAVALRNINEDEITDFVEWTRDLPIHVRFIEFMPFVGNQWKSEKVLTYKEILDRISVVYPIEKLNDSTNSTAKSYQVPGFKGTFAVISTITDPFCTNCNRMRLTTDGKIKNCLFSNEEVDLLSALRNEKDIHDLIRKSIYDKHAVRGGLPDIQATNSAEEYQNGRQMVAIGG